MSHQFRAIGGFSNDAITLAMRSLFVESSQEMDDFERNLSRLSGVLTDVRSSAPVKEKTVIKVAVKESDIFEASIIDKLRNKMLELRVKESAGIDISLKFSFLFKTDYSNMSISDMVTEHRKILDTELTLNQLHLIVRFYRGVVYLNARERIGGNYASEFFTENFGIHYITAHRYMKVSLLILKFPRLLAAGFTHTQLQYYSNQLDDYLMNNSDGLREDVGTSFLMWIGGEEKYFSANPNIIIPKVKFSVKPDADEYKKGTDNAKAIAAFEKCLTPGVLQNKTEAAEVACLQADMKSLKLDSNKVC